jgi:hypothetical protein
LEVEVRNAMVKEIESEDNFLPTSGVLTPPIKGRGQQLWARDNTLFMAMNDTNVVMKGTEQAMALILDGKGEQAVSRLARVVALEANVISRLNGERLRIHYPKELASKVLRPNTEPILRTSHKLKAKQAAQEVRDTNVLLGPLFRKGGRNGSISDKKHPWKRAKRALYPSFPPSQRRRAFKPFRTANSQSYQNKMQNTNVPSRKPPQ